MAVAYFKVRPKNMSGGTEKKVLKSSDRAAGKAVKIQTLYPLNTSLTTTASLVYHSDWIYSTV